MRKLPFLLLVLLGAGSLLFDLTLGLRLPGDRDWAEAAGFLRAHAMPGDALQPWPVWAERARVFVDAMPVVIEENLLAADYVGVKRLFVLSLPRAPFSGSPAEPLLQRGATRIEVEHRFGALALQAWDLHAPLVAAELTQLGRPLEEHEVDYVARRCAHVAIGSRFAVRGAAAAVLHLRAGIIGERAYDPERPEVRVQAFADGAPLGELRVPWTQKDGTGWHRLDVPLPAGAAERDFVFAVSSADASPPFCIQAWTSER